MVYSYLRFARWNALLCFFGGLILASAAFAEPVRPVVTESPFYGVDAIPGDDVGITRLALDPSAYGDLKQVGELTLTDFVLSDGRHVDLRLRPMEVFARNARLVQGTAEGDVPLQPPDVVLLHGHVVGSDSSVFLSLSPHGSNGWVRFPDETFIIATAGPNTGEQGTVIFSPATLAPDRIKFRDWQCHVDQLVMRRQWFPPEAEADDEGLGSIARASSDCQIAQIAVETDWEFTGSLFGGDTGASSAYATSLIGAVSEIYSRDVNAGLQISFLRVWSTSSDPWTEGSTIDQLYQFQNYWNANMTSVERNVVHFLSGRGLGGGVAYLPGLCNYWYDYGLSANLSGFFPYPLQNNHSQNWDVFVVAHELGHNFGAPHTHDMTPPIDGCAFGDCSVTPNGTIMSYCHGCPGGMLNILLEFHDRIRNEAILPYLGGVPCDLWVECGVPAPVVVAEGSRYLAVTPQPADSTVPVALQLTGVPWETYVSCVSVYVQGDGTLGSAPVFQLPVNWGTVHVRGEAIIPMSTYRVQAEGWGGGLSEARFATTWRWGDVTNNDLVGVTDIMFIILGYQGDFTNATLENLDQDPCEPDGILGIDDIMAALYSYQGLTYPQTDCSAPCGSG